MIEFLVGTWEGDGRGEYPTIRPFVYRERVTFAPVAGKPFLVYTQRTWAPEDGRPLHAESGFWRPQPPGRLEVVLAHPTGITEVYEGTVDGGHIELATSSVGRTSTALDVRALERTFDVDDGVLRYRVRMAVARHALTHHLSADLRRVAG